MSKLTIAAQLAAIQKQKDLLAKKEAALRAESHGKVLIQIIKMAKDAGLSLEEIASAYEGHETKSTSKVSAKQSKTTSLKPHTMKGVKLPPKYRNPMDPNQTWTGRGVDPGWVAKLREAGILESALIQTN
jgi:DNA-binding protein H-NS